MSYYGTAKIRFIKKTVMIHNNVTRIIVTVTPTKGVLCADGSKSFPCVSPFGPHNMPVRQLRLPILFTDEDRDTEVKELVKDHELGSGRAGL